MRRKPIHRGGILSAGYDSDRRFLDVEFDTHRIVRYEGVGRAIAERFLCSAQPLSHLRDEIEDEYPSSEISSTQTKQEEQKAKKARTSDALEALFRSK